jgi:hypothetical protein
VALVFYFTGIKSLQYLGLDEMTDPHFSHDRNGNCLNDLFDHLGVALERAKVVAKNAINF